MYHGIDPLVFGALGSLFCLFLPAEAHWRITNLKDVAPISFVRIHPVRNGMDTHEQNGYHAPLISISICLKSTHAHECDVVFEQYSRSIIIGCVTDL